MTHTPILSCPREIHSAILERFNMFAHKVIRIAAVTGLTLAAIAGGGVAQASTSAPSGDVSTQESCPSSGQIGYGRVCTTLSSGRLFHDKTQGSGPVNVRTWYEKSSGGTISAKLGFNYAGTTTWGSTFSQASGTTKSASWARNWASDCYSTIGMLSVTGQGTFQTPSGTC
ncbi:hypothetical protein ACIQUD_02060 [Streptomyces globisporus]|uniref:hypothetical protein n=1 Tax=Streptomyces globisporus TaxID=1908 RepID=UPI003814BDD1